MDQEVHCNNREEIWKRAVPSIRREWHFNDRVVSCFSNRSKSVYQLLAVAKARNGSKEALVYGEQRLTWDAVHSAVVRIASGLAQHGVVAGDRVGLLISNSSEFVIAFLACARLGAISVPLSTRLQRPELSFILNNCSTKVVFHDADLGPLLPSPEDVPCLRMRIAVGLYEHSIAWESMLDAPLVPEASVNEDDTAAIIYTSGTTGHPKGAMLSHLNIVHGAMHFQTCMDLGENDRSLIAVPMSHVTGLIALVSTVIQCASTLIIMPTFRAADFLQLAESECMTHTVLVPTMYNLCLLHSDFERYNLSSWRVGGFGGAAMPPATISRLKNCLPELGLMNAYGATETTCAVAITPAHETEAHLDRVGRIVPCAEIAVMDETGMEMPAHQQGEIWIKGPMVVQGYWGNPQATAENFSGGFWRSGDIGSIDNVGFVGVFDRKKDMINRGGYKIFTVEVENVLSSYPDVLEVAVVAKPCPVLGERVHAFIVYTGQQLDEKALHTYCSERMSDYKVPESFTFSDKPLPRNANGKILKRELRDQAGSIPIVAKRSS